MRKLFWALFVVGCGFNVHGVESSTKGTILGKRSHEEFEETKEEKNGTKEREGTATRGNIDGAQSLLDKNREVKPSIDGLRDDLEITVNNNMPIVNAPLEETDYLEMTRELIPFMDRFAVRDDFKQASKDGNVKLMKLLIEEVRDRRRLSEDDIYWALERAAKNAQMDVIKYLAPLMTQHITNEQNVYYDRNFVLNIINKAKDNAVIDLFIKDENTMQILDFDLRKFAGGDRPVAPTNEGVQQDSAYSDYFQAGGLTSFPAGLYERVIDRMVAGPDVAHPPVMALMKLRQKGTTKVSKLPEDVFRRVLEHCIDIDPQFSAESSDGKLIIPRKELAGKIWVQRHKLGKTP